MGNKLKSKVRQYIEKEWPSALAFGSFLPDYMITEDPTFTRERTGAGSIEYFNEPYINYGTEDAPNIILNPNGETPTLLYDPNTNTADDIKLDLLHHYREYDPVYLELLRDYEQSLQPENGNILWNSLLGEIFRKKYNNDDLEYSKHWDEWNTMVNTTPSNSLYMLQGVDGSLRNLLASDATIKSSNYAPREVAELQWLSTPESRKAFNNIQSYLTSYRLPEITVISKEHDNGGNLNKPLDWNELSMKEKAAYIRMGVARGFNTIDDIKLIYHLYANGGNLSEEEHIDDSDLIDFIIKEEGFLTKPTNIGDGKITIGSGLTDLKWINLYNRKGRWSKEDNRRAVAEEVANRRKWAENNIPNWNTLPNSALKALLSYKYNYDFTPKNSPLMYEALRHKNYLEAAKLINATSTNPAFVKGLEERRKREQEWFLQELGNPSYYKNTDLTELPISTNTSYLIPTLESNVPAPILIPDSNQYVSVHRQTPEDLEKHKDKKTLEGLENLYRFNKLMGALNILNNISPKFIPLFTLPFTNINLFNVNSTTNSKSANKFLNEGNMYPLGGSLPAMPLVIMTNYLKQLFAKDPIRYRNLEGEKTINDNGQEILIPKRARENNSPTKRASTNWENKMAEQFAIGAKREPVSNPAYDVPFLEDKKFVIDNATTSTNVIDTLAKYTAMHNADVLKAKDASSKAKPRKVDFGEALGLLHESVWGALPVFNRPPDTKRAREMANANYFTAFGEIPAEYLVRDWHYKESGVDTSVPPMLDAIRYYAEGDYNTNDKGHTFRTKDKGKEYLQHPVVQLWIKENKNNPLYKEAFIKAMGGNLFDSTSEDSQYTYKPLIFGE